MFVLTGKAQSFLFAIEKFYHAWITDHKQRFIICEAFSEQRYFVWLMNCKTNFLCSENPRKMKTHCSENVSYLCLEKSVEND